MIFERLKQFRQTLYTMLGNGKDALFDLMDATITSPDVSSFVRLSLSPLFRRKWSSVYNVLKTAQIPRAKVLETVVREIPTDEQPMLAGDATLWERPDAVTLKDRTYSKSSQGNIGVGHSYSTLAWIPDAEGSWACPLLHDRITSFETPVSKAAFQLKQVSKALGVRPLATYDRGYGNGKFVKAAADAPSDLLLRLPSNRCVWGEPGAYKGRGAYPKHGHKFKFNAPLEWLEAEETIIVDDPEIGRVKVRRWYNYHFRNAAKHPMDILRVEVIEPKGRRRKFSPLWIAWVGQNRPVLETFWKKYLRRFALEHWYRLAKQRLHWTLPQVTTQRGTDCWSQLMILMTWHLWFARHECVDTPLPWQTKQDNLSPGRVAQGFGVILAAIGTPAKAPKPRGKAPGCSRGQSRKPKTRYPIVRKHTSKPKKTEKSLSLEVPEAA